MQKYWKFILIAVVVAGLLYFLTISSREGLTSNPPVANPLPGQGPQAGQGASMTMPPAPSTSPSSGNNLASSSSPVGGSSSSTQNPFNAAIANATPATFEQVKSYIQEIKAEGLASDRMPTDAETQKLTSNLISKGVFPPGTTFATIITSCSKAMQNLTPSQKTEIQAVMNSSGSSGSQSSSNKSMLLDEVHKLEAGINQLS